MIKRDRQQCCMDTVNITEAIKIKKYVIKCGKRSNVMTVHISLEKKNVGKSDGFNLAFNDTRLVRNLHDQQQFRYKAEV